MITHVDKILKIDHILLHLRFIRVSAKIQHEMQVETIREEKRNFIFKAYIGTEHNFFPLTEDNKQNYDIFNWDKVADDWLKWLKTELR